MKRSASTSILLTLTDAPASKKLGTVVHGTAASRATGMCKGSHYIFSIGISSTDYISRRKVVTPVVSSGSNTHAPRTSPVAMGTGCGRLNTEQAKSVSAAFNSV